MEPNTFYFDELRAEARDLILAECERTGESIEEVINRWLLAEGRARYGPEKSQSK